MISVLKSGSLFVTFVLLCATAQGGVVYTQMTTDFVSLQTGISASLERIETKEAQIISKNKSENKGKDLLGYVITSSSVRVTAFRLQGVLRLLVAAPSLSNKTLKDVTELYANIKLIEDSIGKMDEALTTLNNAIKKGAADKKIKELRKKADSQSQLVAKNYEQIGWFKKNAAEKAIDKLSFLDKMPANEESEIVRTAITSEIVKFQTKIATELLPGMSDEEFSHDSMELNFHEFRRQIRWVAIYFSSLPQLFSLTPYTLDGHTPEQQEILIKFKGNKYAEIKSENSPIKIDRFTFYNLARFVQFAGDAKDVAEEHFKLLDVGVESDLDEEQFKADMVKMMADFLESGTFERLLEAIQ